MVILNSYIFWIQTLLKSCKAHRQLQQVHVRLICRGLEQDHFLITQFICLSNSLSTLLYSSSVFDRLIYPSTYLWNVIIRGYCEKSCFADTVSIFNRMKRQEGAPDRYTYPSLIKVCTSVEKLKEGRSIHGSAVRCGVGWDLFVNTSLIDLYGKCKDIVSARKVFDEMSDRNVVSWTAMVSGYVFAGDLVEAKRLFDEMPHRNVVSWNAVISGFVKFGDMSSARRIFDEMPEKNVVSFTTMIDGYAKAGQLVSARSLFEKAPERDIVAWSALISGYCQNGQPNEAISVFIEMHSLNVKPDEFIMVSLMSACSQVGSLELAKRVDHYVATQTSINLQQSHVLAALVDMNAKCGNIERATSIFEMMPERDIISYCSMIQGLSIHGYGKQTVSLFNRMLHEGLRPDEVAFTVILSACSHAGLVEEGCYLFESMINEYSVAPSPDHFACMVDLFSRSGKLKAAYELLNSMPMEAHAGAWGALLGACKLHGDVELGKLAASRLFELEPLNSGNYVLLSSICAAAEQWLDASLVRNKMIERGIKKIPGCSRIGL